MMSTAGHARRKRRVWPAVVFGILALVVAAALIAEPVARILTENRIASNIRTALQLSPDYPVAVSVEGLVVPQLIHGRFATITASAENVTYEGVSGSISGTGKEVTMRGDAQGWRVNLSFNAAQLKTLLPTDYFDWTTVSLRENDIAFGGEVKVLGVGFPVQLWATPTVSSGDLVLTPSALTIAGAEVTASEAVRRFGDRAKPFVAPRDICIKRFIPRGATLAEMAVKDNRLIATVDVDGAIAHDASLREKGTCE